jgi:hypothetical protein
MIPAGTLHPVGDFMSFTNVSTNSPQRFYRIRTVD